MNLEVTEVDGEDFQADRALNENRAAALRLSEAEIVVGVYAPKDHDAQNENHDQSKLVS